MLKKHADTHRRANGSRANINPRPQLKADTLEFLLPVTKAENGNALRRLWTSCRRFVFVTLPAL